jgi:hypothetical protein
MATRGGRLWRLTERIEVDILDLGIAMQEGIDILW